MEQADTYATEQQPETTPASKVVDERRKALVKEVTDWVRDTRTFWEPVHERMRDNMNFAGGDQWEEGKSHCDRYQVNFTQRQLNQAVAAIYARNPTVTVERKTRLEHTVWDGTMQQLEQAKMEIEQAAMAAMQAQTAGGQATPPPAEASAIVMDYAAGRKRKMLADKISETLEHVITFEMDEQKPDFDGQMKSLVLREKITGAAFLGVKLQRETETVTTTSAVTTGIIERMQAIQAKAKALQESGDAGEYAACAAELQLMVNSLEQQLQGEDAKVLREGLVFDFKPTTSILIDPACRCLHEFVGANRIAELFYLTPEQVMMQFQVDVKKDGVVRYGEGGEEMVGNKIKGRKKRAASVNNEWPDKAKVCVAYVYDKFAQLEYVVCDGYEDFLQEPQMPFPPVKGFWPMTALKLKRVEVEQNEPEKGITIFGQSDVDLIRPMQQELNRSQEALREHRVGNRPGYFFAEGTIDKTEAQKIGTMPANTGIGLKNVPPGTNLAQVIVPKPTVAIDPRLYEKETVMNDVFLTVGSQSANLGSQTRNEKATGQAIAEQSRIQGVQSEVDEVDKFLTEVMRISGEIALQGMSAETVKRKVGVGAVWPSSRRDAEGNQDPGVISIDDCLEQFVIKIEAASSGRANQALDISNFEKMQPMLLAMAQAMGLPLDPLVRHAAKIMDFKFDIEEWLTQKQPMAQPGVVPQGGQPDSAQVDPGAQVDPAGMRARVANTQA